jgi:hypothetical protein
MKIGTQTKTDMISSKITKAEVYGHFQHGRRCNLGKSSACYNMGNYRPISIKFGTQIKTAMLSSKIAEVEVYGKRTAKINCKKRYRFKKATLYEREVIKKQKIFIRWQKLPYSYNRWLGNHSLKATYHVNQLLSSFYTCIKTSLTLEAWNTRMHYSFNFIRKFKQLHCPVPLFIAYIQSNA